MNYIQNNEKTLKNLNPHVANIGIIGVYFLIAILRYTPKYLYQVLGLFIIFLAFIAVYFIDQLFMNLIFYERIQNKPKFILRSFLSIFITIIVAYIFYRIFGSLHYTCLIFILVRPIALGFLMYKNILINREILYSSLVGLVVSILEIILGVIVIWVAFWIFSPIVSLIMPKI